MSMSVALVTHHAMRMHCIIFSSVTCLAGPLFSTLLLFIIIIIIIVFFMQGIYTYIPETNCVPREYSVAAILLLLFMVLVSLVSVLNLLYFYISTFRSILNEASRCACNSVNVTQYTSAQYFYS